MLWFGWGEESTEVGDGGVSCRFGSVDVLNFLFSFFFK